STGRSERSASRPASAVPAAPPPTTTVSALRGIACALCRAIGGYSSRLPPRLLGRSQSVPCQPGRAGASTALRRQALQRGQHHLVAAVPGQLAQSRAGDHSDAALGALVAGQLLGRLAG